MCPTITSLVAGSTLGAGNFSWMYPQWLCDSASLSRHAVQFSMLRMHRTLCSSRCSSFSRNSNKEVPFKLCPLSTTLLLDNLKQNEISYAFLFWRTKVFFKNMEKLKIRIITSQASFSKSFGVVLHRKFLTFFLLNLCNWLFDLSNTLIGNCIMGVRSLWVHFPIVNLSIYNRVHSSHDVICALATPFCCTIAVIITMTVVYLSILLAATNRTS